MDESIVEDREDHAPPSSPSSSVPAPAPVARVGPTVTTAVDLRMNGVADYPAMEQEDEEDPDYAPDAYEDASSE